MFPATEINRCPKCGGILPTNAVGPCTGCLLSLGEAALDEFLKGASELSENFPKRFGAYELLGEIARGGMGVVYRARELTTKRVVALKMIRASHLANEAEVKRFQTEAEAAANLDHSNIVPIYEVSLQDGQHYFTMKLIEGGSLADRIAADPLEPSIGSKARQVEAAQLVAKIARAVHHAHQRGILHRDLKPSNILLNSQGEPFISDFGLAKLMQADSSATLSDAILGTAPYMSPEQASGKTRLVTTASDVWALGVILYQIITGQLPLKGENHLETLRLIQEGEPVSPLRHVPSLSPDIAVICLKCLEKDATRRYASADLLAEDLDLWLANRPIKARSATITDRVFKWIKREPIKATASIAIAGTAVVTTMLTSMVYLQRLPHMASEHAVATSNYQGEFLLRICPYKQDRVTQNFFRYGFEGPEGQWLRLDFIGLPLALANSLRCQIRADQPGRPDPTRSPVLTNGQMFQLRIEEQLDRNFYVASVGWSASNVLAITTNGYIKLTLLTNRIDYPGDHAPLR